MVEYAGPLVQLVGFVVAAIILAATMRTTLKHVQTDVSDLKQEMKDIADTLKVVAVQANRLDTIDKRLDGHDHLIDDLRRGEGFIFPLANRLRGE